MLSDLIFGTSKKIFLLNVLLDNIDNDLSIKELSNLSFISDISIRLYLRDFEKEGIILKKRENTNGTFYKYKLNLKDKRIKALYSLWVNDEKIR